MQDNKYTVDEFMRLAKITQGEDRWNLSWNSMVDQLKGRLKSAVKDRNEYFIFEILCGVSSLSNKPFDVDYQILLGREYEEKFKIVKKYEEKEQPMKIDMNKKYRRVGTHEPVRVICVDRKDLLYPCLGLCEFDEGEGVLYFDSSGYDKYDNRQVIEEVPAVDWYNIPTDTLIWVDGHPRYFADIQEGAPRYFTMGTTSRTYKQMGAEILPVPIGAVVSLEEPK